MHPITCILEEIHRANTIVWSNVQRKLPRLSARPQFGLDTNVIAIEMKIEEIGAFYSDRVSRRRRISIIIQIFYINIIRGLKEEKQQIYVS